MSNHALNDENPEKEVVNKCSEEPFTSQDEQNDNPAISENYENGEKGEPSLVDNEGIIIVIK